MLSLAATTGDALSVKTEGIMAALGSRYINLRAYACDALSAVRKLVLILEDDSVTDLPRLLRELHYAT